MQLLSRYTDYVPLESIVDQLLLLDNDKLTILLPHELFSASEVICNILQADLTLDEDIAHLGSENEHDPPSVQHAQKSRYWSKWLATMHKELEALKVKEVYEEVDSLPPSCKAIKSKWVLHIK
jgi:hypothetical protein